MKKKMLSIACAGSRSRRYIPRPFRPGLLIILIAFTAAMVFAHDGGREDSDENPRRNRDWEPPFRFEWNEDFFRQFKNPVERGTINGSLTISRGMIAVISDGVTYYAVGLSRFINFIDGLKEGADVILDGYISIIPGKDNAKFMMVQKMILNGREYDLGWEHRNGKYPSQPDSSIE